MLTILLSITSQATATWQNAEAQRTRQQNARIVFELVNRDLESMLLPPDSDDQKSFQLVINPASIASDLKNSDAAFWQATQAVSDTAGDIAQVGYFVRWIAKDNGYQGVLCRYYRSPTQVAEAYPDLPTAPLNWIADANMDAIAPGDAANNFRGMLAENVIGWWVTAYDADGIALPKPFDSRQHGLTLASLEVVLAMADPRTAARIESPSSVTSLYSNGPDGFWNALPDNLKSGVRIFRTQIPVKSRY